MRSRFGTLPSDAHPGVSGMQRSNLWKTEKVSGAGLTMHNRMFNVLRHFVRRYSRRLRTAQPEARG